MTIANEGANSRQSDALYRKVTVRLVPFMMISFMFAVIDRLNIGMAKLQMLASLGFSDAVFGLGAGIFFIGYLIFDVPSNLMLHKVGARWWLTRIMITWGIVTVATAFVTTPFWFYGVRFVLGLAEAGFFAGLVLYSGYWFPPSRRGRVYMLLIVAVSLAGGVGGPLGGFVMTSLDGALGLAGWQWLFVAEGIPSIICGFLCLVMLDDRIARANWLSADEKALLKANLDRETTPKNESAVTAFITPVVWLMCLVCFAINVAMYAVGFWLPTIIRAAGVDSSLSIGFYSAIPSLLGIIPLLITGRTADKSGARRLHVAVPLIICGIGLALSTTSTNLIVILVTLTICYSGALSALAQFWSLPASILVGYGAAAGIALVNSIGSLGGFFSPTIIGFGKTYTGSTNGGMLIMAAIIVLGGVLALLVPSRLVDGPRLHTHENDRRGDGLSGIPAE